MVGKLTQRSIASALERHKGAGRDFVLWDDEMMNTERHLQTNRSRRLVYRLTPLRYFRRLPGRSLPPEAIEPGR